MRDREREGERERLEAHRSPVGGSLSECARGWGRAAPLTRARAEQQQRAAGQSVYVKQSQSYNLFLPVVCGSSSRARGP